MEKFGGSNCNVTHSKGTNPYCTGSTAHISEITSCSSEGDVLGLKFTGVTGVSALLSEFTRLEEIVITSSKLTSEVFPLLLTLPNLKAVSLVNCQLQGIIPDAFNSFRFLNLASNPGLIGSGNGAGGRRALRAANTVSISESFCAGSLEYFNVSGDSGLGCYPSCLLASVAEVDVSGLLECPVTLPPTAYPTGGMSNLSSSVCLQ
jgi:hypothetical protein